MQCSPNLFINGILSPQSISQDFSCMENFWETLSYIYIICSESFISPDIVRHRTRHMFPCGRTVISYYWHICTPSDDFCCSLVSLLFDLIILRNVHINQYKITVASFFACFQPGCCPVITLSS